MVSTKQVLRYDRESPRKALKTLLFCLACVLVFLTTAAVSCGIRAKYRELPKLRASSSSFYAGFLGEYFFLQYNQAGGEQGRTALLVYLGELQRIQNDKIKYPEKTLHLDTALTYLRLYRLEAAANNSAKADEYLRSAQKELLSIGQKDSSAEHLKAIETRESEEARLYNSDTSPAAIAPVTGQKP